MKQIVTIIIFVVPLLLVGCGSNYTVNKNSERSEYRVLIGEDSSIVDKVSDVDLLIIDAAYFSKEEIALLKSNKIGKVYSYLNIGSIETFRSYYNDFEKYTIGDYENWPEEQWMDVSQPKWQEFILNEGNELVNKGIDGFFIDNVDVYYQFTDATIYKGLVDILSGLKGLNKPVLINGGDLFVKEYVESNAEETIFDGVNQEDVYTSYDFSNECCVKNAQEEKQYYTDYLDMLLENGYQVYVLEYATDTSITKEAYSYSKEHQYICYVSDNIELKTGCAP